MASSVRSLHLCLFVSYITLIAGCSDGLSIALLASRPDSVVAGKEFEVKITVRIHDDKNKYTNKTMLVTASGQNDITIKQIQESFICVNKSDIACIFTCIVADAPKLNYAEMHFALSCEGIELTSIDITIPITGQ